MLENLKKIKYISIKDILGCFIFIFILPISIMFRIFNKFKKRKLWLIAELKDTCRDNGYHFFKYVRENHPEDYCFYVIDKKCDDYQKIKKYGNVIQYGGFKFWLYYMAADLNIGTNKAFDPDHPLFYFLHIYLNLFNNCVFLQHGITKDDAPMFYYKNTKYKLFICGAKPEYDYIKEKFGYPENHLKYTGFARFDNLHDIKVNKNQILIMPTWRNWLGREVNFLGKIQNFEDTDYFKYWNGLINNKKFIKYIEENNLIVKFYPHYQMSKYIDYFVCNSKNIVILDNDDEDIQKLLMESELLITDYSSVYMDFAYMEKPIIYFQFDKLEYRQKQLQEGYFNYEKDGFGKVVETIDSVVEEVISFNLEFKTLPKYKKRMNKFFELKDTQNCKRIYEEIIKIGR